MAKMTWCVQGNLGARKDLEAIAKACHDQGHRYVPVTYVPFSITPPQVDAENPCIFYGSPNLIRLVVEDGRWTPGAYWDDETFRFSVWGEHYGDALLSQGAHVVGFGEWVARQESKDQEEFLFVRPDGDLKSFSGMVVTRGELCGWAHQAFEAQTEITPASKIVVAPPRHILREWRCFVVQGEVVAATQYRGEHGLSVAPGAPDAVKEMCQELAQRWSPAPAFVLDVALTPEGYGVIEVNGLNSSGFYAACIADVVRAVSQAAR